MEGKLIKTDKGNYVLVDPTKSVYDEGYMLGSSRECDVAKLSLKNCQAIERGYDLDELIETNFKGLRDCITDPDLSEFYIGVIKCFTLEILGDKKFSEEDMKRAFEVGEDFGSLPFSSYSTSKRLNKKEFIQSLQQNEWDVTFDPEELDADGCLILKRK